MNSNSVFSAGRFCCCAAVRFLPSQARPDPNAQLASKELNARVEALLKKMTLDEKIGQLVQYSAGFATGPALQIPTYDELVAKGQVGSMLNVVGAEADQSLPAHCDGKIAPAHSHSLWAGCDSWTSHDVSGAAGRGGKLGSRGGRIVARSGAVEARADGIGWVFSPMVDIARDPRWGRIVESNGEDPYLGSAMARAWVNGYQQDDLSKPDSVAVMREAFCRIRRGNRGPRLQRRRHERNHVAAGVSEALSRRGRCRRGDGDEFVQLHQWSSRHGRPFTLTQILRKEWGFDGFVVSDWGAVAELKNHAIGDGADGCPQGS